MRQRNDTTIRILLPAAMALGFAVLASTAVSAIAAMHLSPRIGDIVTFTPSQVQPIEDGNRLIVHRPDQFGCVLDLGTLNQSGGSLVVESEIAGSAGSFRVHWAGERTSTDTANCGEDADLILDRQALDLLAVSGGGYGADHKHLPPPVSVLGY